MVCTGTPLPLTVCVDFIKHTFTLAVAREHLQCYSVEAVNVKFVYSLSTGMNYKTVSPDASQPFTVAKHFAVV
jgi:hypothetical protein